MKRKEINSKFSTDKSIVKISCNKQVMYMVSQNYLTLDVFCISRADRENLQSA